MNGLLNSNRSRKAHIKKSLMLDIGRLDVDDRIPSELQLARRFHVNRLTINKVMSELHREGHIRRVPGRGTFVSRPDINVSRRSLACARHGRIVIAYPDYHSFDLWSKVNVAEDLSRQREVELINLKMGRHTAFQSVATLIKGLGPDLRGVILLPPASTIGRTDLSLMDSLGVPVVLLAACEPSAMGKNTYAVHRDYYREGFLAMDCLLRAGHRRIGYVSNEPPSLGSDLKFKGAMNAMCMRSLDPGRLLRSPSGIKPWTSSMHAGYRYALDILDDPSVTALLCCSASGAIGAMRAASERERRIPTDLSLVATGQESIEALLPVSLTTTRTDHRKILAAAFDLILNNSGSMPRVVVTEAELIEQESVSGAGLEPSNTLA